MAEVFVARDALLDRLVALKLMHPEYARDTNFIARFRREAQAAASLNDPRIVSIYDWGSDDGTYFIVMEYVEGSSLGEIIRNSGRLPVTRAVKIAGDVLSGLHLAHQKGIVHRDVKPANIAITAAGQTKVMDFGIARAASDGAQTMTQTGTVIGTASYFSPEQAQGKAVDARSDIYSVGIVLYEMLTGRVPFKGENAVAVAYKHVTEDPVPPRVLAGDIPPALEAVVMKALAKNPENRYQTAEQMRLDLARAIRGEEVEAPPLMTEEQRTSVMGSGYGYDPATQTYRSPARRSVLAEDRPLRQERAGRGFAGGLLVALILVLAGIGILAFLMLSSTSAPDINVPDVTGRPVEQAVQILRARGLASSVDRQLFSADVPAGAVISQGPEGGRKVRKGQTVNLTVSKGPEQAPVPQLAGLARAEAEKLLADAGLDLGDVTLASSATVAEGRIISQSPAPPAQVSKGTPVSLVVSTGQEQLTVPTLTDLPEQQAQQALSDAGLTSRSQPGCDTSRAEGVVVAQSPAPGTKVPAKAPITLSINRLATVPQVVGMTEAAATAAVEGAGFKVQRVAGVIPFTVIDTVTNQDPQPGQPGCAGGVVRIVVG